ncbi:U3 small nucleolar RNA-associated protein 11 [Neoconidiobolus thromboides FSU 785]|nr:U3 small nucleolar RNA-associated protein 11 [Neoconidiobolus thromboides FSU 785]
MSSLRNSVQRRNHAERSQPARRQHLGILEKHKDYKLRATDYHKKQDTLKKLREKARFRNEDEFYFKMINTKTKGGVHIKERSGVLGADIMKLLRTQDSNYIQQMINIEQKQIEKLKDGLSFIDEGQEEEEEEEEEEEGFKAKKKVKHTIFVDEDENIESFDVADHFDTLPSLVEQKHLRLRKSTLKNKPLDPDFMKKE